VGISGKGVKGGGAAQFTLYSYVLIQNTFNGLLFITLKLLYSLTHCRNNGTARGKINFNWIPGHCGVEVNDRAGLEAKQSNKEGKDTQLLLPKGKEELHSFYENTKRDRGQSSCERHYRNGSSP
jgi:hypothetical protein